MHEPPAAAPRRSTMGIWLVGLMTAVGLAVAGVALREDRGTRPGAATTSPRARDAELYDAPFRNARPGVRYVGDAACARCHAAIAETYGRHPMGRSLARVPARAENAEAASFDAQGLRYVVQRHGAQLIHREERVDSRGRVVAGRAEAVEFALGSGRGGRSFLFERDGFLFESPISWFAEGHRWDLSPGYATDNHHFERAVASDCLYCHANRALAVEGTTNRYRAPIFDGLPIGCERCHGPGELHVRGARADASGGPDLTIVNPRRLDRVRRDSVCQQCHLKGDFRVLRAGRVEEDFRPGLPFHRVWSVFFRPEKLVGKAQAVGHVEQMESSRCYEASGGALGCISCHDPHARPEPEERVAYFRERCLECHGNRGCALPEPSRRAREADDSCIACHMPRTSTQDIAHAATTLHRIPRRPEDPPRLPEKFRGINPEREYLAHYRRDQVGAREVVRDHAVALATAAWSLRGTDAAASLAQQALPILDAAARERPDDLAAREFAAVSLWLVNRPEEASTALLALSKQAPERESARWSEAGLLAELGRRQDAIAVFRDGLERNPWPSHASFMLANLLALDGEWRSTADACRQALRSNFAHLGARRLLAEALLRQGAHESARAEFEKLLAFDPQNRAELVRWFEALRAPGQASP